MECSVSSTSLKEFHLGLKMEGVKSYIAEKQTETLEEEELTAKNKSL